jgi:trimeric autotransporter adhesin
MPNVFTPNNDGLNERFIALKNYNIERITLFVYNRWGERIFETNNVTTGWDGGEFSSGIYFWYASYVGVNGKLYSQKGQVQLIR